MRRRLTMVLGVPLMVIVAGCSSTTSTTAGKSAGSTTSTAAGTPAAAAPLPKGAEGPVTAIPWSSVGPGWLLALWGPDAGRGSGPPPSGSTPPMQETTTLFLVDPLEGRYQIAILPAPPIYSLAGWSGDGRRALVTTGAGATEIDLATGDTLDHFAFPGGANAAYPGARYTRPSGLEVLAVSSAGSTSTLDRLDMTGSVVQAYPTTFSQVGRFLGTWLSSPDGTRIVMGAESCQPPDTSSGSLVGSCTISMRSIEPLIAGPHSWPVSWSK